MGLSGGERGAGMEEERDRDGLRDGERVAGGGGCR